MTLPLGLTGLGGLAREIRQAPGSSARRGARRHPRDRSETQTFARRHAPAATIYADYATLLNPAGVNAVVDG